MLSKFFNKCYMTRKTIELLKNDVAILRILRILRRPVPQQGRLLLCGSQQLRHVARSSARVDQWVTRRPLPSRMLFRDASESLHRVAGLPRGLFLSRGYQVRVAVLHLLSLLLAMCPAQRCFALSTCWRASVTRDSARMSELWRPLSRCWKRLTPTTLRSIAAWVTWSCFSRALVRVHVSPA